ncbi:hypothetical protein [Saccharomonospora iraqiensis]|uniref:hypothetical protein n=1 Tax=Saccharomonospora iraqiensis TaxID=52698 RepID=UPI0004207C2B|nr:hypothetical protein [Saccharomonospora iraqiensis]
MDDIPVNLSGYRLMVTEEPTMKMRENKAGEMEPATDRYGVAKFVVMLFAKPRPVQGQRTGKGEEIKVTLVADPGEGFEEGSYVELINPILNTYEMRGEDGRITASGVWFKADGLKPAGPSISSAPSAA